MSRQPENRSGNQADIQDAEQAVLVEDLHTGEVVVERENGERWVLDARKGWCPWSYEYEGKPVLLRFGKRLSVLVNDRGETYEFWTEKQIGG